MILLMAGMAGCTSREPPSTPAQRTPTKDSITRDNPGGDAHSPIDAALERLLNSKIGYKEDKFETLNVHVADWKNWKRIRFFGYPTRAGFRYGKDPTYAASVILYSEAEDDSPASCVEAVRKKAHAVADVFDVEVGPMSREMHKHKRGVEAVNWPKWEQEWRRKEEARIAKIKRVRKERLKKRKARIEKMRKRAAARAAERRAAANKKKNQAPDEDPSRTSKASDKPGADPAATAADEAKAKQEEAQRRAKLAAAKRRMAMMRNMKLRSLSPKKLREARAKARAKNKARMAKLMKVRPAPVPPKLPKGDMPVILTSGQFETIIEQDEYLGAIVAYESWPGTCLIQGFAVKIGTDRALADKVRRRWLTDIAPRLRWKPELREQPPVKNR